MTETPPTITVEVALIERLSNLLWDAKSHLAMHLRLSSENRRASDERVPFRPLVPFPMQISIADEVLTRLRDTVEELKTLLNTTTTNEN